VTLEIENYPGFPKPIKGDELAMRLKEQAEGFGVETVSAQAVTSIRREGEQILVKTKGGDEYCCKASLLAVGSTYRRLGVKGEDDFIGAGVHFYATCDGPFYKNKKLLVIGGGNSGFQEGIFLTKFASKVVIIERDEKARASRALQDKAESSKKIEFLPNRSVEAFKGSKRLESVVIKNLKTGGSEEIKFEGAFVFIGLEPNTDFLKRNVALDEGGFIKAGESLETNVPGVFAAGDCRSGSTKQVASAVGEGATAALMIRRYLEELGERGKPVVESVT
jgi:thioredoxin reductase (NADPH)